MSDGWAKDDLLWIYRPKRPEPGEELSRLVQIARQISAHNIDPQIDYQHFNWGDYDGSESAHTLGTDDTDWAATGGSGDLTKVLRGQFNQPIPNADQNLTQNIELQVRLNGGTWYNIPSSGGGSATTPVEMANDSTYFTDGGDTTLRVATPATYSLLSNNNCEEINSYATASFTFTASTQYSWEAVYLLKFLDTHLSDGDTLEFQFLKNGGTALDAYTGANPQVDWSVAGANVFYVGMIPVK